MHLSCSSMRSCLGQVVYWLSHMIGDKGLRESTNLAELGSQVSIGCLVMAV